MPCDAVGYVNRILVHPEVDIVRRLNIVANEAWVASVFSSCQGRLIQAGRYLRIRRTDLVLKDSWNVARILPVDGAEIEVLVAKAHKQFLEPDGVGTLANYGPKALISGRHLKLRSLIELEGDSRRRRRDGQL